MRTGQRPCVATGLEIDAIEDVLFARDELANVAWAVERRVEGVAGGSVDRTTTRRREAPTPTGDGGGLRYRLSTTVPAHWLPLVPVRPNPAKPDVVLRRGRVLIDVDGVALPALQTSEQPSVAPMSLSIRCRRACRAPNTGAPRARQLLVNQPYNGRCGDRLDVKRCRSYGFVPSAARGGDRSR